ncbi:hypothetical protein TNCV_2434281 [Trichonephila clavipes]|nr:hypothetical protein TNCV_2434281 [Trichonephila clavipes]
MTLITKFLRRNRRQWQSKTFDRGRIIGLREAGWSNYGPTSVHGIGVGNSGLRYRRGGSGRPKNTNFAIRRVATGTNNVANRFNATVPPSRYPVPSRENHKETFLEPTLEP